MTDEERKATQNIVRVGTNLGVLLDIALFPGKHSVGIKECQDLVQSIVAEAQGRLNALLPPPAPPAS